MSLVRRLRELVGMNQAEFASVFGVGQPSVSLYESGRRSPNLDVFEEKAEGLGRRVLLAPSTVAPAWNRSEQFSRLLYLEVASSLLSDPVRVRRIAEEQLEFQDGRERPSSFIEEWRRLLDPVNEPELLMVLCVPDPGLSGLLSSSPFAGVVDDDTRSRLLSEARVSFEARSST